jgi:hypothetical protein
MASKVLITGGSGLVGSQLQNELKDKNIEVNILTTSALRADQDENYFFWNIKDQYIDNKAFNGVEYIIHLAGAGVADKRWTAERKKEIEESRVLGTRLLREYTARHEGIKGIVAASAVGYYGMNTGDQPLEEDAARGEDFLSDVVVKWEHEIMAFQEVLPSVSALRIGVVLSEKGGALARMKPPFDWGFGAPLGSGKQWMSWIHIEDLASMFIYAMENNLHGVFNAVAPEPATNAAFSKTFAQTLKKPFFLPNVPAFVLKVVFGEMAQVVLGGNRVSSRKIIEKGYSFRYPELSQALQHLFKD